MIRTKCFAFRNPHKCEIKRLALREIERLWLASQRDGNIFREAAKFTFWRFPLLLRDIFDVDLSHMKKLIGSGRRLTRRNSLSPRNRKNRYRRPDEVYKRGRVGPIKNRVRGEQKTAADVKCLISPGVALQFFMGHHCISDEQSSCSRPADRIKPELIPHTVCFAAAIRSQLPFLWQLLLQTFNLFEQVSLFFHTREHLIGTEPQEFGVFFLQTIFHFVPSDRRGSRWFFLGAQ